MKQKIVIIGAGFSGLAAAITLAHKGYDVLVIEKNNDVGGRARQIQENGFTIDIGPTWYWMPDIIENFFRSIDENINDHLKLVRLDPSYRIYDDHKTCYDLPANYQELEQFFESMEDNGAVKLKQFINEARYKYGISLKQLSEKPQYSFRDSLDPSITKGTIHLDLFGTYEKHIKKYFDNKIIRLILEFPIVFLGGSTKTTPALYSSINYGELFLGTWYPMGGIYKLVESLYEIALKKGVRFSLNNPVTSINVDGRKVSEVITNKATYKCDFLLGSADYQHIEQSLLIEKYRNYNNDYWNSRTLSPSCLLFQIGLSKKLPSSCHHTVIFGNNFHNHIKEIFESPNWPHDPTFYVCTPSITDPSIAPNNCELLYFLLPIAVGLEDDEFIREHYYDIIIEKYESVTNNKIKDHILFKKSFCISDFMHDYNAYKGNAYGLANTQRQTAYLKPSMRNNQIDNLIYLGHMTVPGPGVPPAIVSGQIAANEAIKLIKTT
ncbi:MAG: phytoene desaturase family protein [Hyphomicrobiales bacterium]